MLKPALAALFLLSLAAPVPAMVAPGGTPAFLDLLTPDDGMDRRGGRCPSNGGVARSVEREGSTCGGV